MPIDLELGRAISEGERDFGEADRLARVTPVENDVSHFTAAKRFGGLLAEHPTNRVEQIGFAATVWTNNRSHAFVEIEESFIGERFEAEELERL